MNNNIKVIVVYFVVFWIGGAMCARNDNGIKQRKVHIPVWLNMILFLKNDHRALFGLLAFQTSLFIITIISLLSYYFKLFNNPYTVFYYLMIVLFIIGGMYAFYLGIRDFIEHRSRKNKRF